MKGLRSSVYALRFLNADYFIDQIPASEDNMKDEYMVSGDGRKPRLITPPKACETHSHIYGPADKYPRFPGRKPDFGASVKAYEAMLNRLGFERCVIVQPSLYSTDNRCTLDAIAYFGRSHARGVAVTQKGC